jgi:acyl-CoA synthetase (AMP-forming)/AMP-acid ligase II
MEDLSRDNIAIRLRTNAQKFANKPALIQLDMSGGEKKRITFSKYYQLAVNVANTLLTVHHVKKDDVIVLVFIPGTLDVPIAFLGCVLCGVIPNCVFPPDIRRPEQDIPKFTKIIQDCGASIVITNSEYYRLAFRPFKKINWPPLTWLKVSDLKKGPKKKELPPPPDVPLGSYVFLQYTVCTFLFSVSSPYIMSSLFVSTIFVFFTIAFTLETHYTLCIVWIHIRSQRSDGYTQKLGAQSHSTS